MAKMHRAWLVLGWLFALTALCVAQADEIRRLEQERVASVRSAKARERFIAADYFGISRLGSVFDSKAMMALPANAKYSTENVEVRLHGSGAISTGVQHPQGISDGVRFLRLWVREADRWKVAAFHATLVSKQTGPTANLSSVKALMPRSTTPKGPNAGQVLAADERLVKANLANDVVVVRSMRTADFFAITRAGTPLDLAATPPAPLQSYVVAYDRVQSYGDIGVVQGMLMATALDGGSPGALRFTRIWVNQNGAWKLAADQRTAVAAQASGPAAAVQDAEQEIMKAEQARLEARRKGDGTMARLLSDDHLTVGPNGQVVDKKGISALNPAPNGAVREQKIQQFGDTAVATGTQSGMGANEVNQRFTRIWRKESGQWLNVFGHVTRIAQLPALGARATTVPETVWPKAGRAEEAAVIDTQRRIEEAYARKDAAAYGALTSTSYMRFNPDGSVTPRAEYLKIVAGKPEDKRALPSLSEFRVRVYGPLAVLTWLNRPINGPVAGIRRSRLFVKDGGSWKQLISQDTLVSQQQ